MVRRTQVVAIIVLALPVYGILWYVANGFVTFQINVLAMLIAASIAYLFSEALLSRRLRSRILRISIHRRLDISEVSRIFGPIALLPTAAIAISRSTFRGSVKPLRLYILVALVFLVGWALGTVETAKLVEPEEKVDRSDQNHPRANIERLYADKEA